MANQKDPGWLPSLRGLWWFLIPIVNMKKMSGRRTKESALIVLRTVVLGIVASLFLFLWAMSFITPWDGGDERWVPWAVVVIGVVSLAYIARIRRRPSRQLRQRPLPVITEHWSSSGSVSPRTLPCWDSLAYSWGAVFGSISSAWPSVSLGYG